MRVGRAGAGSAALLVCALVACNTDSPLENRRAPEPTTLTERPSTAAVVTTSDTLEAVADAHIRSVAPNTNYGAADSLTVRTFTANTSKFSVYVRFDQAAIDARVGAGQLDSAKLEFYLRDGGSWPAGGANISAYRIPNSWAKGGSQLVAHTTPIRAILHSIALAGFGTPRDSVQ